MRSVTRILVLLIFIIGIYELLSLMRGNDAIQRAAIVQAYHYALQYQRRYEERYHLSDAMGKDFNIRPPSAEELRGSTIRRITHEQGGVIRIELDGRSGVDGGVLVNVPLMKNGRIDEWTCVTNDYPSISSFLPACRYIE